VAQKEIYINLFRDMRRELTIDLIQHCKDSFGSFYMPTDSELFQS
jgi:hypothetical protein